MQFIFSGAGGAASCSTAPKAVAPVITDETLTIAAAAGIVAADVFLGTAGDPAPYGGFVSKTLSCDAVKIVVSYLDGDDCNPCTVDTLETVDVPITIPAGATSVQLPAGYIAKITAQVVDSAGVAKNSALGGDVQFTSSRAGACGTDVVIPASTPANAAPNFGSPASIVVTPNGVDTFGSVTGFYSNSASEISAEGNTTWNITPRMNTFGVPAGVFSVSNGTLPAGLSLNTSTGNITGTLSPSAVYSNFSIRCMNSVGYHETEFYVTVI